MDGIAQLVARLHVAVAAGRIDGALFATLPQFPDAIGECEVLDFKRQLPASNAEYAKLVRDLVALHNSYGGFVVYGIGEIKKDRLFEILGVEPHALQFSKLRDLANSHCSTSIRLQVSTLSVDHRCLEAIWVAKRDIGQHPVRFSRNGPDDKPGSPIFRKGDVVFRRMDCNAIASNADDYDFLHSERRPPSIGIADTETDIGEPLENNMPDRSRVCPQFVGRKEAIGDLWEWIDDDFSRVRLIAGEGGLGKTSLAYRFSEDVVVRRTQPFEIVVWLSAKRRQFIAARDEFQESIHVDFDDALSLFSAIGVSLGRTESEFIDLDYKASMQLALECCQHISAFVVIDDIDSLGKDDQLRVFEFAMRAPGGTKLLLTTRVNFSYSPDNVLKLDGLPQAEFKEYISMLRERYRLPAVADAKLEHLRDVTSGSPLFADSLIRLERRGIPLDKAMVQWKGERGLEVRKAALEREIQQLSREAKRALFLISTLSNCSYTELSQVTEYTDQTLGDALQELSGLFLISAPSIAKEARYTVEPNTGLLVIELTSALGIDHTALVKATKRLKSDAIGISLQKRSGIVALAISEAMANVKTGKSKNALDVITAASKKLSKPHPDLLLAAGRFNLLLTTPNYEDASKAFNQAYSLGQRKPLLFNLWYKTEYQRGSFEGAIDVATKALANEMEPASWYERRAQVRVTLATRSRSRFSRDAAIREIDAALDDFRTARASITNQLQLSKFEQLIRQAEFLRNQFVREQRR